MGKESSATRRRMLAAWEQVRRDYFPRWDPEGEWRLSLRAVGKIHGLCEPEKKTVTVCVIHDDPDHRDCLLIHEICHVWGGGKHALGWQRRMTAAASRAQKLGRPQLAKLLEDEVKMYSDPDRR